MEWRRLLRLTNEFIVGELAFNAEAEPGLKKAVINPPTSSVSKILFMAATLYNVISPHISSFKDHYLRF